MLKPEIPPTQLETIQPILDSLLARLRVQTDQLQPQADSALVYLPAYEQHEDGQ
jgi:hypothetical protein